MAAHRYWRIYINTTPLNLWVGMDQVKMYDTIGGTNLAKYPANGTATASSVNSPAYGCYEDPYVGTTWTSHPSTGYVPQWNRFDFGSGNDKDIIQIKILNRSVLEYSPGNFKIQYSDDDSAWTDVATFDNVAAAGAEGSYYFGPTGSMTGALSLPALTSAIYSGGAGALTLPLLATAARDGANVTLAIPALTAAGYGGADANLTLPSFTSVVLGHDSTGEQAAAISLPMLSVEATAGANATATLPSLSVSAAATATGWAIADIEIPALTAASTGTVSGMGRAAIRLPSMGSSAYAGALCSVTIGGITVQAEGTTGGIGGAQITLPLFEAVAVATAQNYGSVAITLPSLSVHSGGNAATVNLPSLTLTAIGTATVTVTYEAYALNLNHKEDPRKQPVDELTRYTNYPFDKIVRYKNSYFGMNSTGLYLLEGTTDDGTAIAWDFKTHISDFGTAQKKTVEYAYFGGRMPAAVTVTLHVGEKGDEVYNYTTPRGAFAQNYRQAFGRGVKSRYYALEAAGSGDLTLDSITLNIATLARKV